MKAFVYDIVEYNNLIYSVSNNNVEIVCDGIDGWYYIVAEDYTEDVTDKIVYDWLGAKLNVTVVDIVIDTCKEKVAVIYN